MIRKIITIVAIILATSSAVFAVNMSTSNSIKVDAEANMEVKSEQNIDSSGLMADFDNLVDTVKKEKKEESTKNKKDGSKEIQFCTKEYNPVCAEVKGKKETFSNRCMARMKSAEILYKGRCGEKKNDNDKIILGPPVKINQMPIDVKIKGKIEKEKKVDSKNNNENSISGDPHVWEKDGRIIMENKSDIEVSGSTEDKGNFVKKFKVRVFDNQNDSDADGDAMSIKSIAFGPKVINFEGEGKVEIKNDKLFIDSAEVKIDPVKAEEKAKDSVSADVVLSSKIEEEDEEINYVVETKKSGKFLGIFDFDYNTEVKINAKTGKVEDIDEPWYSFLIF